MRCLCVCACARACACCARLKIHTCACACARRPTCAKAWSKTWCVLSTFTLNFERTCSTPDCRKSLTRKAGLQNAMTSSAAHVSRKREPQAIAPHKTTDKLRSQIGFFSKRGRSDPPVPSSRFSVGRVSLISPTTCRQNIVLRHVLAVEPCQIAAKVTAAKV